MLDIRASAGGRPPDEAAIEEIASEAFMPVGYGGGVRDLETATRLIQLGVEKIVVNAAMSSALTRSHGSPTGWDARLSSFDRRVGARDGTYEVVTHGGTRRTGLDVRAHAEAVAASEPASCSSPRSIATETMRATTWSWSGLSVAAVDIPVVACGGAGSAPADSSRSSARVGRRRRPPAACSCSTAGTGPCSSRIRRTFARGVVRDGRGASEPPPGSGSLRSPGRRSVGPLRIRDVSWVWPP